MLVQDTLTGYFHEVPDSQFYAGDFGQFPEQIGEGQVGSDGFGAPVWILPAWLPIAPALAPAAAGLIGRLFQGRSGPSPAAGPPSALPPMASALVPAAAGLFRRLVRRRRHRLPIALQPMAAPPPPTGAMMSESALA